MSCGPAARGGGLLKFLVWIALIAAIVTLAFATAANWRRTGVLSFHVFDSAWWSVGRDEAQPLVDQARQAYGKLWGEGGLIDEADHWLRDQSAAPASAAKPPETAPPTIKPGDGKPAEAKPAAPSAPAPPVRSAEAKRYEDRLSAARGVFEDGVEAYRRANPAEGGWTDEKKRNVQHARQQFARVRDMLAEALPAYETLSDHDPATLKRGRDLQRLDQQLFYNANKMSGGL